MEMKSDVLALSHHLEIARIVVPLVTVNVMHDLTRLKRSPEHFLSDHAMFVPTVELSVIRTIVFNLRLSLFFTLLRCSVDRLVHPNYQLGSPLSFFIRHVIRENRLPSICALS